MSHGSRVLDGLAKRIIPCLDVDRGRVVKGVNFVNLTDAGDPVESAKLYENEGADEIVFLDITASSDNRGTMLEVVRKTAETVFLPFSVGGGIRSVDDIRNILSNGADKVCLNTAAVLNPDLIQEGAEQFGVQCIVVAIDSTRYSPQKRKESIPLDKSLDRLRLGNIDSPSGSEVYINGGRTATKLDVLEWVKYVVERGAGEILLTSIDRDGTNSGYDLELLRKVTEAVNVPVIASGGAGTLEHFRDAIEIGGADAVLAASVFHFGKFKIREVKNYLSNKGIPVRL